MNVNVRKILGVLALPVPRSSCRPLVLVHIVLIAFVTIAMFLSMPSVSLAG